LVRVQLPSHSSLHSTASIQFWSLGMGKCLVRCPIQAQTVPRCCARSASATAIAFIDTFYSLHSILVTWHGQVASSVSAPMCVALSSRSTVITFVVTFYSEHTILVTWHGQVPCSVS